MRRTDFMLGGHNFKTLVAAQIMETNIHRVNLNSTWREAAKMLADNELKSIPVVDDNNKLVGLITEYDILAPIAAKKDESKLKAFDVVSKNIQVIPSDMLAFDVLKLFDDKRVFKVLVVDDGDLKGVIVKHDIICAYLSATEEGFMGF